MCPAKWRRLPTDLGPWWFNHFCSRSKLSLSTILINQIFPLLCGSGLEPYRLSLLSWHGGVSTTDTCYWSSQVVDRHYRPCQVARHFMMWKTNATCNYNHQMAPRFLHKCCSFIREGKLLSSLHLHGRILQGCMKAVALVRIRYVWIQLNVFMWKLYLMCVQE